ncbi:MAG: hypothetical protein NZM04_06715 [Methylacidiphilales bacterium]|nr:hypothetical protein [Candidatus Methylacidiphilales bacterium]
MPKKITAAAGGTAAMLGGGDFANGAISAAFTYLFNEAMGFLYEVWIGKRNLYGNTLHTKLPDKANKILDDWNLELRHEHIFIVDKLTGKVIADWGYGPAGLYSGEKLDHQNFLIRTGMYPKIVMSIIRGVHSDILKGKTWRWLSIPFYNPIMNNCQHFIDYVRYEHDRRKLIINKQVFTK